MADRWEQFRRVKDFADAWAAGGAGIVKDAVMAPLEASQRIMARGVVHPSEVDESLAGDALVAGPGALLPGFGRAAGGLGVGGARILQRADARKMVAELRSEGKTAQQIADALNERFAPLLDEGAAVKLTRGQANRIKDTELGVMGGQRSTPTQITPEMIDEIIGELGLAARTKVAEQGTTYKVVHDPAAPGATVKVRVPPEGDPHGGRNQRWQIDTSTAGTNNLHRGQMNIAGETYEGNPAAVREQLRYVFGKPKPEPAPAPAAVEAADPRQLKLLAGGAPGGWQTTVERGDPGRFSRPVDETDTLTDSDRAIINAGADNELIKRTKLMTERVAAANEVFDAYGFGDPSRRLNGTALDVQNGAGRFARPIVNVWDQFARVE